MAFSSCRLPLLLFLVLSFVARGVAQQGGCEDTSSFQIKGRDRDCEWVGRRDNRCDKYGEEFCPATCNMCPGQTAAPTSGGCRDLPSFVINGKNRNCNWISKRDSRCQNYGDEFCPVTCGLCEGDTVCTDLEGEFIIKGKTRDCSWIGAKEKRCIKFGASRCPVTCGLCVTPAPTVAMTLPPTSDEDCYTGDGSTYRGNADITVGGISCQNWARQSPNSHRQIEDNPGAGLGNHNFCRNPSGPDYTPWCYNGISTSPRWDYCALKSCSTAAPPTVGPTLSLPDTYISADSDVYTGTDAIRFNFRNENPQSNTWIGIYPAGSNPNSLPSPSTMWLYACESSDGSSSCLDAEGTITFDANADIGGNSWPLCNGDWQAFLINDQNPNYNALAYTNVFTVTSNACSGVCGLASSDPDDNMHETPVEGATVSNVAFGSCHYPSGQRNNALWRHVRETFQADVWNWLGDNMYSDSNSMEDKRNAYNEVRENSIYQNFGPLANPKIPVTGTWDDHDYGYNNYGDNYQCRKPSQDEFAIHFNIPSSDVRHPNQGANQQEGIYSSNMFSKPGGGNGIHLINLDARYHRSPTFSDYGSCKGSESKMLSDSQWTWLESELERNSEIKIIGSGTQVLPPVYRGRSMNGYCAYDGTSGSFEAACTAVGEPQSEDWLGTSYESWAEIPQDRTKLLQACQRSLNAGHTKQIVFISGDQHWAEIMVKEMPASNAGGGGSQKLYEVTASGIDQNWPYTIYNSNRVRTRSADHEGSGLFDVECNSECATGSGRNRPWCSTSENGGWGYCADSELVSKDKQTVTGDNTCTDQDHHTCSAEANYGGISVDWNAGELLLGVYTPHENNKLASSVTLDI